MKNDSGVEAMNPMLVSQSCGSKLLHGGTAQHFEKGCPAGDGSPEERRDVLLKTS
jgi:hypothetical protein